MSQKIKLTDIVFREDLYPRFEPDHATIQKYANSIEFLPPIKLSQHNILIDGFHRWKAHQLNGESEISAEIIEVASEKELKKLAYQMNSIHGLQLTSKEKSSFANEMIGELSSEMISKILGVSVSIINEWTKNKREQLEEDRNRKILELYLRAWNTQQSIADIFGLTQQAINKIFTTFTKSGESCKDFEPFIYDIWNLKKQDNATTSHFGSFPLLFMQNLLHYHTKPFDIVFDPFAGGGTTIDACKQMRRRFFCTDLNVKAGREKDIIQHDITTGLPDMLPKPDMVFLDPPYWLLANKEYSEESTDFGNMTRDDFFQSINKLVLDLAKWKVKRIAYVIRPIWVTGEEWEYVNPTNELKHVLKDFYDVEMEYILPYSSEQYSGLWVNRAKEKNKCLILKRELTVFKIKENGKISGK